MKQVTTLTLILLGVAILGLNACGVESEAKYPTGIDRGRTGDDNIYGNPETITGDGGLLGNSKDDDNTRGENGVQVNSYLWRAALDTISFMPVASADPFGGTIITDWYADPKLKGERTKLNVFILGRELKASNLRVKAFRQVSSGGAWKDATVAPTTERALEDANLTRARQMRVSKEDGSLF